MKRSKFTESQIMFALKQNESGLKAEEVCRKMGVSEATFYNWKKKYSGLGGRSEKGREYVEAYVDYTHTIEAIHDIVDQTGGHSAHKH